MAQTSETCWLAKIVAATVITTGIVGQARAAVPTAALVRAAFAQPAREYSSGPLWVWNDLLTKTEIRGTLRDLAQQHVKQAWVHPRPGLMTPYLERDWFRMWKFALAEAERLDMNLWIYDENSYPSGFAGGLVPEAMPESRGQGLHFAESPRPGKPTPDMVAEYQLTRAGFKNVTRQVRAGEKLPAGRYLTASRRLAPTGPWFAGKYYVDLIRPGVTQKFIDITMGAYQREIGRQFGKRVPGWFTDEPHLTPAGGIHWGDYLPGEFAQRWDYDLLDHLPSLMRPLGDWKRVRHNYQQYLLEKFVQRWSKPCYQYCEKHHLEFTGHYWEHGWPGAAHGGDNMAMYAWHQRPAIDNLMNEYNDGVHAQFGNARTVRELASVANQLGRKRTLCETYGAGGWDLRFEDMKRIGDWLYVLGINTLNQHLSYITIRGARKRDHPQSFSYHTPWWEGYHKLADYFARLSLVMSSGAQVNRVLVIEPTTSAWMYQPDPSARPQLDALGNAFQDLINKLERVQAEYDIGCEDIMARHGRVKQGSDGKQGGARLVVGARAYRLVVLPSHTENLNGPTMALLENYVAAGGQVLCCGPPPERVDGRVSERGAALAATSTWRRVDTGEAIRAIRRQTVEDGLTIHRRKGDKGLLFHQRRHLDDGQFLLLVNTSIHDHSAGQIQSPAGSVEQWDLEHGTVVPYPFARAGTEIHVKYDLPPCGSLLLLLADQRRFAPPAAPAAKTTIQPVGPPAIRRVGPNVLTIDYVDLRAGDKTLNGAYFYRAEQLAFAQNGMARDPWDSAVQFHDTLITHEFPPQSGFQATYRFTIEGRVPRPLHIVVERPDLYVITCNGRAVTAEAGRWWLDKSFGQIDVSTTARVGDNQVTLRASPMTVWHELESAYVIGDFSLKATHHGFTIVPPVPLRLGPPATAGWNRQGCPLYAAGVAYTETFDIAAPAGRYHVCLPDWYGSVARVTINGHQAGYIGYRPWQCDVTRWIRPGSNEVELLVIGTLKNTLGPHHAGHLVGKAWPHSFQIAPPTGPPPGNQYDTVGYGLSAPFTLVRGAGKSSAAR